MSLDQDLADLIFQWGGAYMITWRGPGDWIAVHRDTSETLYAATPDELRDKLRNDQA